MTHRLAVWLALSSVVVVSGCITVPDAHLEDQLIAEVEAGTNCAEEITLEPRSWDRVYSLSRLSAASKLAPTRQMLSDYASVLPEKAFTSRWPADRTLLRARFLLEQLNRTSGQRPSHEDVELCIRRALPFYPAAAWELRAQLYRHALTQEGKAFAYFSFSKAIALSRNASEKLRILKSRQTLRANEFTGCQWRLVSYYLATDAYNSNENAGSRPRAPNDTESDYAGSFFSSRELDEIQNWSFPRVPRCKNLTTSSFIKAGSSETLDVLGRAFGVTELEELEQSAFCDSFDYQEAFNPNTIRTRGGPLGALGEALTNMFRMSLQRPHLRNDVLQRLVQDSFSELRATLPPKFQRETAKHSIVIPIAPTLFAREFECRITSSCQVPSVCKRV